ncbi:hypothetical protein B0T10DRAFT_606682 [Thelonectria olida]|uniref:Uncharacterized protein n=1 Tax=Thelonectria olida TaxID=1576542 RepID=A0A9P9ASF5_9HYPO|nr:hypothetical protein B0T10DRAFT_606682 [Thelonectria olida]
MTSEPISSLRKAFNKFNPAREKDGAEYFVELDYGSDFSNESVKSTLEASGGGSRDIVKDVKDEFFPMARKLQEVVDGLTERVDGPTGVATTARNLIGLSKDHRDLLASSTASLASYYKARLDVQEGDPAPGPESGLLDKTFGSVRQLKTQVSAITQALHILTEYWAGSDCNKLDAYKETLSPPYGNSGKTMHDYLGAVIAWHQDRLNARDILSEAHRKGLDSKKEVVIWPPHYKNPWDEYSFEYWKSHPKQRYTLSNIGQQASLFFRYPMDEELFRYIDKVPLAQVVNGQVQFDSGMQDDNTYANIWNTTAERESLGRAYHNILPIVKRSLKYVGTQDWLRKSMLYEASLEEARKEPRALFEKFYSRQQASYAAAGSLKGSIDGLMSEISGSMTDKVNSMQDALDDIYLNLMVEDFESALESWNEFSTAYDQFDSWVNYFRIVTN